MYDNITNYLQPAKPWSIDFTFILMNIYKLMETMNRSIQRIAVESKLTDPMYQIAATRGVLGPRQWADKASSINNNNRRKKLISVSYVHRKNSHCCTPPDSLSCHDYCHLHRCNCNAISSNYDVTIATVDRQQYSVSMHCIIAIAATHVSLTKQLERKQK